MLHHKKRKKKRHRLERLAPGAHYPARTYRNPSNKLMKVIKPYRSAQKFTR